MERKLAEIEGEKTNKRGRTPQIFLLEEMRRDFADALVEHGESSKLVHEEMTGRGWAISLSQVQKYLRWMYGSYPAHGRPPKFCGTHRRRWPAEAG